MKCRSSDGEGIFVVEDVGFGHSNYPHELSKDPNIPLAAKGLYAVYGSFVGKNNPISWASEKHMCHLCGGINDETFRKYKKILIDSRWIGQEQSRKSDGTLGTLRVIRFHSPPASSTKTHETSIISTDTPFSGIGQADETSIISTDAAFTGTGKIGVLNNNNNKTKIPSLRSEHSASATLRSAPKKESSKNKEFPPNVKKIYGSLSRLLYQWQGIEVKNSSTWLKEIDLMLRVDKRDFSTTMKIIKWYDRHKDDEVGFVVESAKSLRRKFLSMKIAMEKEERFTREPKPSRWNNQCDGPPECDRTETFEREREAERLWELKNDPNNYPF